MTEQRNPNVAAFRDDVLANGGYRYTTNAPLSSRHANERLTRATLELADLRGQSVLDIGCGDGTYAVELYDRGGAAAVHGIDPAAEAVGLARRRAGGRRATFAVGSAYDLPCPARAFDWGVLRGVLHHLDRPADAVREGLRACRRLVVVEPNGLNPVLKLLEIVSPYHRAHDEKSYRPGLLRRWVRDCGGRVVRGKFAGLVPMFCPAWMARACKLFEPVAERVPLLRAISCAVYVFVAEAPATARAGVAA